MKQQGLSYRLPTVAFIVVMTFCSMVAVPAWSQSSATDRQQGTPSGVGMQVASVAATLVYFPCKAVYALGGGIVGGVVRRTAEFELDRQNHRGTGTPQRLQSGLEHHRRDLR